MFLWNLNFLLGKGVFVDPYNVVWAIHHFSVVGSHTEMSNEIPMLLQSPTSIKYPNES